MSVETTETPQFDPFEPDEAERVPPPGASDSTLLFLLVAVVFLLMICIAFVLIAS